MNHRDQLIFAEVYNSFAQKVGLEGHNRDAMVMLLTGAMLHLEAMELDVSFETCIKMARDDAHRTMCGRTA